MARHPALLGFAPPGQPLQWGFDVIHEPSSGPLVFTKYFFLPERNNGPFLMLKIFLLIDTDVCVRARAPVSVSVIFLPHGLSCVITILDWPLLESSKCPARLGTLQLPSPLALTPSAHPIQPLLPPSFIHNINSE